jgi:hypothetical protein
MPDVNFAFWDSRKFASTGISEAVWYEPVAWVWSKKVLRRGGIRAYR